MNMRMAFLSSGLAALGFAAPSASALPVVTIGGTAVLNEGQTSSQPGVAVLDFNTAFLPPDVTLTAAPGNLVSGSAVGLFAAPPGDASRYLSVSPSSGTPVMISLATAANYIGFYAGSLDGFNHIEFFDGALSVASYSGAQLAAFAGVPATGDQSIGRYFNVFESGNTFTSVVLTSTSNAFELDNFAIGIAAPTNPLPLPGSLSLFAVGLMSAGMAAKRAKSKQ